MDNAELRGGIEALREDADGEFRIFFSIGGRKAFVANPLLKILMPKMDFKKEDRLEVIRQAYQGLYELAAPVLFDKYLDFIDIYSEITEDEKESVYQDLKEHKETAMLAQHIKNKGFEEGMQQGMQQGKYGLLERILTARFGPLPEWLIS